MVKTTERAEISHYEGSGKPTNSQGLYLLPGGTAYSLDYSPLNYALGNQPQTAIQRSAFERLQEYIHGSELRGRRQELPDRNTSLQARPRMIVIFGNGEINYHSRLSYNIYHEAGDPAPQYLLINSVAKLPEHIDLTVARTQIAEPGTHCGLVLEGEGELKRALWISTQGNWNLIAGSQEEIVQNVAWRFQEHFGSPKVSTRYNEGKHGYTLDWRVLSNSPAFTDISTAAHLLGEKGIIKNEVDLRKFTHDPRWARMIGRAFNRNGVGESMRSEFDPAGFLAVTRSGGGKVEVDPDPSKAHLTPVWAITPDGYIVPRITHLPKLSTLRITGFSNGSVETHENVLLAIARSLAIQGCNFEQVFYYVQNTFAKGAKSIPIQPTGLPQLDRFDVDHAHWHTEKHPDYMKITYPNYKYFPMRDFACGTIHAAWAMISGFMELDEFHDPEALRKYVLGVELPGHGYVYIAAGNGELTGRERLNRAIISSKLRPPACV